MDFEQVISTLKSSLAGPLPGQTAQMRFSPRPINQKRFGTDLPLGHRKGAVLILIYPQAGEAYLPLIKRPEYPGVHSGQIALPGGKMDATDPDLIFTALREAEEEVAVKPNQVEVLGSLTDLFIPASNFLVSPVVGISREIPDFYPEEREVQRIIQMKVAQLMSPATQKQTLLDVGNQIQLDTPYFEIENEMVWGATAMILSELLCVIRPE